MPSVNDDKNLILFSNEVKYLGSIRTTHLTEDSKVEARITKAKSEWECCNIFAAAKTRHVKMTEHKWKLERGGKKFAESIISCNVQHKLACHGSKRPNDTFNTRSEKDGKCDH